MDFSVFLALAAVVLHLAAYWLYNSALFYGNSNPNPATWFIWSVTAGIFAFSYTAMSNKLVAAQAFAGFAGCVLTFIFCLFKGKLARVKEEEFFALWVAIVSLLLWKFKGAVVGNYTLVVAAGIGYLLTLRDVIKDPTNEKFLPWFLWAIAFTSTGLNALISGKGVLVVAPQILLCLAHHLIAVLSLERRKK